MVKTYSIALSQSSSFKSFDDIDDNQLFIIHVFVIFSSSAFRVTLISWNLSRLDQK